MKNNNKFEEFWIDYYEKRGADSALLKYKRVGYASQATKQSIHNSILSRITKKIDKCILDAGCGDGDLSSKFVKENEVLGVDTSSSMLIRAKKKGIKPILANISNIPLPNKSVDIIICAEVLTHTLKPNNVLDEFFRLIRKQGEIIITGQNSLSLVRNLLKLIFEFFFNKKQPQLLNIYKLKKIFLQNNFKIHSIDLIFSGIEKPLSQYKWIPRKISYFLATNFIIHVIKE